MKPGQTLWTREELILAVNLYCTMPFGQMHRSNPQIIALSKLIGRTPSSVALKLVNFASLDPSLKARGIKGAANSSKLDKTIWDEFYNDWDTLSYESERLRTEKDKGSIISEMRIDDAIADKEGLEKEHLVRVRVNQNFFRKTILASYNFTCCITGISQAELLVAGHIRRWSDDAQNRMNPRNGLCLNYLHDKAFELGYITITDDYRIKVSSILKKSKDDSAQLHFLKYENEEIILPSRFLPNPEFLKYHNNERFKA